MKNYNYIINPINNKKISLRSQKGRQILTKYMIQSDKLQIGGVTPLLAIAGINISLKTIAGATGFLVCVGGAICYLMNDNKTKKVIQKHNIEKDIDLTPETQEEILKDLLKNQEAVNKILNASHVMTSSDSDIEEELRQIEEENQIEEKRKLLKMTSKQKREFKKKKQEEEDLERELEEILFSQEPDDMEGGVDPFSASLSSI